jgi:hypothetical protein
MARKSHHLNGRAGVPPAPRLCSKAATVLTANRDTDAARNAVLRRRYLALVAW